MEETQRLSSGSTFRKLHRTKIILLFLFILLILAILVSFMLGKYPISPSEVFRILFSKILPITPTWEEQKELIFFNVRLPRILLACMVGCCLSAAGAAYQGTFKNPMASRIFWAPLRERHLARPLPSWAVSAASTSHFCLRFQHFNCHPCHFCQPKGQRGQNCRAHPFGYYGKLSVPGRHFLPEAGCRSQ